MKTAPSQPGHLPKAPPWWLGFQHWVGVKHKPSVFCLVSLSYTTCLPELHFHNPKRASNPSPSAESYMRLLRRGTAWAHGHLCTEADVVAALWHLLMAHFLRKEPSSVRKQQQVTYGLHRPSLKKQQACSPTRISKASRVGPVRGPASSL